ncbi:hypothetical protein [Romboutsia sp.]|uniref:hypothetical protein n=1 Tax=Romboutsia sp. TaxID=1965302 RepID=UPI003F36410C
MNRRKTIYKGFNKRKKRKGLKVIIITISICLISGYTYTKVKDTDVFSNIVGKLSSIKLDFNLEKIIPKKKTATEFTYEDVEKEVNKIKDSKNNNKVTSKEEVKIAKIDGWSMYTVQVASVEKSDELKKIEDKLNENKIPFSVIEIDGLKKVQTYGFFDKNLTREYIENMRKLYPDSFLSEANIPVLSLEYTNKYSYVENISTQLNKLIKNYEQESEFWKNNKLSINLNSYNSILTSRKQIITDIEKEVNKIDYKEMKVFKDNLIKYINEVDNKIELSSKASNEQSYQISQGLFLSCMQGYLEFINSIKEA